jgi:hypothetical protein
MRNNIRTDQDRGLFGPSQRVQVSTIMISTLRHYPVTVVWPGTKVCPVHFQTV